LDALIAGQDDGVEVREDIAASWQRSATMGLRPDHLDVPFESDLDSDGLLARAARPVLDQLAVDLADAPVGVLLTNDRGQIVDRRVASGTLSARLDRILLAPGFVYAEDVVGTNGIGTALALRAAAMITGDEHFVEALTAMACAGAPIFDPGSARLLGVIDFTALTEHANSLMLPLATRAAREVELRVLDDAGLSERMVLHRFLQQRRRAKGPLVFLTETTMITNAAAGRLIDAADEPRLRDSLAHGVSQVVLARGVAVNIEREPLVDGGARIGDLLKLKPTAGAGVARRQARTDRPTFGWESLTDTELSVIQLVADGLTNREAGERLFLSHHTVGFHLRSIFAKLGVNSRLELSRVAYEHDEERRHAPA
jgi:transcriptional regulator of acetoin/glycerol metabolism/DNA-binding CsgD family transcriptional regulator